MLLLDASLSRRAVEHNKDGCLFLVIKNCISFLLSSQSFLRSMVDLSPWQHPPTDSDRRPGPGASPELGGQVRPHCDRDVEARVKCSKTRK